MTSAVIVGSGPNGLACAAALVRASVEVTVLEAAATIGGGTRTEELTGDGTLHDVCSAVHPMAAGSPFLEQLGLGRHGLEWCWPEVDCAHPLDDGSAGVMLRSLDETAAGLEEDGAAWRRVFAPARKFEALTDDIFRPLAHIPRHPLQLARFGMPAAAPATLLARAWSTPRARALFGGVAAHALAPLNRPLSSSVGMALTCACHAFGWPVARGGSRAITDALAAVVREHGGRIETGVRVTGDAPRGARGNATGAGANAADATGAAANAAGAHASATGPRADAVALSDLTADAIVFDLAPIRVAEIAGARLPPHVTRAYRRYKHGPGAFKVDFVVDGGIPWTNEQCRHAGTVHAAGGFDEVVHAEREINRGRMPERPFVLLAQQYLADPSRSRGDLHPVWSYAHVPSGYTGDATEAVVAQIERFAPGFRDRIVATAVRTTAQIAADNDNFVGGDIINGANNPFQVAVRPRPAIDPYSCGATGLFICSAATPPGAGVHGMNGYNAAQSVLRQISRR